jgi:hypothetical protein
MFSTSSWRASASLIPRQRTRSEGHVGEPGTGQGRGSQRRVRRGTPMVLTVDTTPLWVPLVVAGIGLLGTSSGRFPACSSRSGGRTVGAPGGASPSGAVARWRSWAAQLKLSATACPLASPVTSSLGQPLVPAFTVAAAGATCRHCGDPAIRERVVLMVGCRADRFVNCAEEETERARA